MADIELVIKISEDVYKKIVADKYAIYDKMFYSIKSGTPLPKGHGRLIDADELKRTMKKDKRKALSFVDLTDFVWLAQTIIEAEKEE